MIPRTRSEVTPAWLSGALPGARVSAIRFGPLQSLTSTVQRLHVTYEGERGDSPATLIWRQSASDPAVRAAFGHAVGSAYEREVSFYFYRDIAPTIETRTPSCYRAAYDPSSDEHVLLLEDLGDSHQVGAPLGLPLAAVRGALRELAHMHASRWNTVARRELSISREATLRFFEEHLRSGHEYLQSVVGPGVLTALTPFRARLLEWRDRLDEGPRSLVHADTHPGNILVAKRRGDRPVIIDWRGWRTGAPMRDVGRCLVHSLTVAQRRQQARSLLGTYLETLAAHGVDYPTDEALDHYRIAAALEWNRLVTFTRQQAFRQSPLREAMPQLVQRAAAAALEALA